MSLTYVGLYVVLLVNLAKWLGVELSDTEAQNVVQAIITLIGLGMAAWGRFRLGNVNLLGTRKQN